MMKKIYDLTELKHTFVSSKTKLFAVLTIIIFMIVGSLHAQAQDDKLEASIDNLDKLKGCSLDEVIKGTERSVYKALCPKIG